MPNQKPALIHAPASTYNYNIRIAQEMNALKIPSFNEMIQSISMDSRFKDAVAQADIIYLTKPLGLSTLSPSLVVQLVNRNFDKTTMLRGTGEVMA